MALLSTIHSLFAYHCEMVVIVWFTASSFDRKYSTNRTNTEQAEASCTSRAWCTFDRWHSCAYLRRDELSV
eukprot:m.21678 g.21678  ORF g.21678 m.21678 type:complete len:71 (+) comp12501_c0_seq1:103-315(+)